MTYYLLGLVIFVLVITILGVSFYVSCKSLKSVLPATDLSSSSIFVSFAGGDKVHYANQELQKIPNEKFIPNLNHGYYENDSTIGEAYYNQLSPELRKSTIGFHCWSWKPYIILNTMLKEPINTIIVYLDSGAYLKRNIQSLITLAERYGRVFFNNWHDNTKYCKCEPVNSQLRSKTEQKRFMNKLQLDASFMLIKNTIENQEFIKKWLNLCMNYDFVSDSKSFNCQEGKSFIDHRHDQALLTLVAFMNPQGQTFLNSKTLYINHHRKRKL